MCVMDSTDFEREIQMLISELDKERDKIEQRLVACQRELATIEHKIGTLQETLGIYREHHGLPQPVVAIDERLRERFAGMSIKDMLVTMAQEQAGSLDAPRACRTLVQIGVFKDYRNASGSVYPTLIRNPDLFEKISRGQYRLVSKGERLSVDSVIGAGSGEPAIPAILSLSTKQKTG